MLTTSARLLDLLALFQVHRNWTGAELADRLGVTTRTVRTDIDRLRELGYPVHASRGVAGGYQLGSGARLPPLLLDDDEAVAVAVGLRTATGDGIGGLEEVSVRALAKLEQVLPSRLRHRVRGLQNAVAVVPGGGPQVGSRDLDPGGAGHPGHRASPVRPPLRQRRGDPARGRALSAGGMGPEVVSRRLGCGPFGLEDLPDGPRDGEEPERSPI